MNRRGARILTVLIASCAFVASAGAEPPRTPVKGAVNIQGRCIEQLVLFDPIRIEARASHRNGPERWGYVLIPGKYFPVSESAEGVFFQTARGLRLLRPASGEDFSDGGLWVSKRHPNEICPYFDNARSSGPGLDISNRRLTFDEMRRLKTGREPAAKGAKA